MDFTGFKMDVSFAGEFEYPTCSTPVLGARPSSWLDDVEESIDLSLDDVEESLNISLPGLQELDDAEQDSWVMDDSPSFLALKKGVSAKLLAELQAAHGLRSRCPPQAMRPAAASPLSQDFDDSGALVLTESFWDDELLMDASFNSYKQGLEQDGLDCPRQVTRPAAVSPLALIDDDSVPLAITESFEDDEWLMDVSFKSYKQGLARPQATPRPSPQAQDMDDTVPLGFGLDNDDDDDDEDLFAVSFGEYRACLALTSSRPSPRPVSPRPSVPMIVVTPPVDGCCSEVGERAEVTIDLALLTVPDVRLNKAALGDTKPAADEVRSEVAAPDDESQPKMKRLMAFWKSVERGERK